MLAAKTGQRERVAAIEEPRKAHRSEPFQAPAGFYDGHPRLERHRSAANRRDAHLNSLPDCQDAPKGRDERIPGTHGCRVDQLLPDNLWLRRQVDLSLDAFMSLLVCFWWL